MKERLQRLQERFLLFEGRFPLITKILVFLTYGGLIGLLGLTLFIYALSFTLPTLETLEQPKYDLPTQVYDRNGRLVTEFFVKRRVLVKRKDIPDHMIEALLAIEDSRFYEHSGIDVIRITKAIIVDLATLSFAEGASTLTQQTAKMFLLSSDKKLIRKIKEILLAVRMEQRFTKDEILEFYLNKAYFGHGSYGIEAAAQGYFSKSVKELNLNEAALLAGLPQAPSRWAPTASLERATKRRNLVLNAMLAKGFIDQEKFEETKNSPIRLRLGGDKSNNETSYFTEEVRRYIMKEYGMDMLYKGGLQVHTTMDLDEQITAQNSLSDGLEDHDRRQGFRGPQTNLWQEVEQTLNLGIFDEEQGFQTKVFKKLDQQNAYKAANLFSHKLEEVLENNHFVIGSKLMGVVDSVETKEAVVDLGPHRGTLSLKGMEWARPQDKKTGLNWSNRLRDLTKILQYGDVIELVIKDYHPQDNAFVLELYQKPEANGAIYAVDPRTLEVRAMSGGYDFRDSEFNRAIQSKRQPGSSFKPIVYSLALDQTYTRMTILDDSPLVYKDSGWTPRNFGKGYKGPIPLKQALAFSKNVPTVRLTESLGVESIIEHAKRLGMTAQLPKDLTIGLGTASVTLQEMVRTYAIFANGGKLIEPHYITRIESSSGKVLEKFQEPTETIRPISEETSFLITKTLQEVVLFGTATRARAIGRPAAGKTGTTNNYTDAWFIGFTPQLLTGVYVGNDDTQETLGYFETGSKTALPVWLNFMQSALSTKPVLPFNQPKGIEMVKVMPKTGELDCAGSEEAIYEFFRVGTAPVDCAAEEREERVYDTLEEEIFQGDQETLTEKEEIYDEDVEL